MANKEAKINSLGSSSRKSRRYTNHDQNEQHQLNSLRSNNAGKLARFNIYETIDTPVKRMPLNRLSSSSTSKLDDPEESKRLLAEVPMLIQTGQSSENQLNKLTNRQNDEDYLQDQNQLSLNCDQLFRRRYQNDTNKFANNQKSSNLRSSTANQSISTNPYSEIVTPTTPVPSTSSAVEGGVINNTTPSGLGHYQVPQINANATYAAVIHHHHNQRHHHPFNPRGAPSVNDEVNQIIETKRKRTLLLLKSKEAPKASFEITSPVEETGSLQLQPAPSQLPPQLSSSSSTALFPETALIEQRPNSPTALSDYENVDTNTTNNLDNTEEPHQKHRSLDKLEQDISQDIDQTTIRDCEEDPSFVSPSESQNFNTLSIVSDILGDLSQEDHSIVNQLSQG